MNRFVFKSIVYLLSLFGIGLLLLVGSSYIVKKRSFTNYQTDGNLLFYKTNTKYDVLIMGISHARNFSRYKNHLQIEKILQKSVINIGQGNGSCGANEQLFYLDYFYHLKNRSNQVIYILSPPMFFSEDLPKASNTFVYEPFEFSFFYRYLFYNSENKKERLISYLQSAISKQWLTNYPNSLESMDIKLERIDKAEVERGQDLAYGKSLSYDRFNKSIKTVEATIDLALKHHSKVLLIIPPALFGKWRGHDDVVNFAHKMVLKDKVEFFDFAETVIEPKYYYDHHHLNTNGVRYFTEKYLKPMVK
jgi:hypothetical protein